MSAEVTRLDPHAATATAFQPLGLPGEGPSAEAVAPASPPAQLEPPAPPRRHTFRNLLLLGLGAGVLAGAYWAPGHFLKPQQPAQRPLAFAPRLASPSGKWIETAPQAGLRLPGQPPLPGQTPLPGAEETPAGDTAPGLGQPGPVSGTPRGQSAPGEPAAPSIDAVGRRSLGEKDGEAVPSPRTEAPGQAPAAPTLTLAPPPSAALASAPSTPAATPTDPANPAAQATRLVAGPMSTQEQLEVLGLVTAMGAKMLQVEEDNAALRDQVKAATGSSGDRWADLERRLSLLEARRALDALQGRGMAAAGAPAAADPMVALRPMRGTAGGAPAAAPAPVPPAAQPGWRVQGGSPHMAVIAQSGGPVKAVSVGQAIDDQLGKVQRIYQQGRDWVVQAERGSIRGGG